MLTISAVVTFFSLALAATMTMVAWRLVREERRRADARVAALSAAIHDEPATETVEFASDVPELFADAPGTSQSGALGLAFVGAIAVAAAAMAMAGGGPAADDVRAPPQASPPALIQPVALVALTHERMARELTVQGTVRAPAALAGQLEAVVMAFDDDGTFVASARTRVERGAASDAPARFVVILPDSDTVKRYRVSFRSGDQVVPHVDERS